MKQVKTRHRAIAALALLLPVAGFAGIIGDWETDLDGWIDWTGAATNMAGGQAEGVTLGSGSLVVEQSGWGQSLAIQLDAAQRADFMANSTFSVDVSVAATPGITAGYSQVDSVSMNAAGAGWTTVLSGTPINFYWWDGRSDETKTLEVDYSAFRDLITDTGYIEIIFALNTGGGAPSQMYFDNAQLVPEPATIGLIGIFGGGLLAIRRRFKL
jgi:hypothetical protein